MRDALRTRSETHTKPGTGLWRHAAQPQAPLSGTAHQSAAAAVPCQHEARQWNRADRADAALPLGSSRSLMLTLDRSLTLRSAAHSLLQLPLHQMRWAMLIAMLAAVMPSFAERFTPAIAPTHLAPSNGLAPNAMLLTRTSMPPGLTAASPAYTAPTADQLADDHAAWAWIGPRAGFGGFSPPLAFLVSRVAEIAVANHGWEGGNPPFFALRHFNGSVKVYEATGQITAKGVEEYNSPYWLNGVYSEMTAGESHMCFLTTDQHAECKTTAQPFSAPDALLASRTDVSYTQLAAASRFTCGLRAVDQLVECFGAVGRPEDVPRPMNYTSTMRYVSIAAQFDAGFCGVVDTGEVACYSVYATGDVELVGLPAPTAPLVFVYPLWMFGSAAAFPADSACAVQSDGYVACFDPLPVDASLARPMSQATSVSNVVQGARSDSGQLQRADSLLRSWVSDPLVSLFEVMRFIGVDPAHGNDVACAAVSTQIPAEMLSFVPCASLNRALSLIMHPHTWVQLLPSVYSVGLLSLNYSVTIIASLPPSCFTPGELAQLGNGSWAARMDQTASQTVSIDCTGSLNCFSTMQSNIQFIGLTFTGSLQHAIVSSSDNSTDANLRLSPSSLTLINCVFDAMGAVLLKQQGTVTIIGCTISNSLPWANTTLGLIELEDASLTMSGTTFAHNHMPTSPLFLRSCLRGVSILPVTWSIIDSHWLNNSASSFGPAKRIPGGLALQLLANGPLDFSMVDSTVTQQHARCRLCNGGAIAVATGVGAPGDRVQVRFIRTTFDQNSNMPADNVDPTSPTVSRLGTTYGGSLGVSEAEYTHGLIPLSIAAELTIQSCSFSRSVAVYGAYHGAAAYVSRPSVTLALTQQPYLFTGLTISNCVASSAGGIALGTLLASVTVSNVAFTNTSALVEGGAMDVVSCNTFRLVSCVFENVTSAGSGGALSLQTQEAEVQSCVFRQVQAATYGGAISAVNCQLTLQQCTFVDIGLLYRGKLGQGNNAVVDRLGAAIAVVGGALVSLECTYSRVYALPNDLQISSCAKFYDANAGLSRIGLGGVVSVEYSALYFLDSNVTDASGGVIYARSSFISVIGGYFSRVQAQSGGIAALDACSPVELSFIIAQQSSAIAAGGAFVLNMCPKVTMQSNVISHVTVSSGDGGLIWIGALWRPLIDWTDSVVSSVSAPRGAGAIIFVSSAPNAFAPLDPIDDPSLNIQFIDQLNSSSLFGPMIATGVSSLSALQSAVSVSAGSLLSNTLYPLQITVLDSYKQVISQDRGLIMQVSCPDVELRGTVLRKLQSDGSAVFSDLSVIAAPANYTLDFSIVTSPEVSIALNLTVTADCPAALFYSSSDRSCIACGSDVLVYNATANACQRCPAGWQRVAANDTSGALRDGVSCSICPLGQVSSAGGLCAPCGPNTYQPTPLSECVQCSTVDGLSCVGDGLAQVQSGYFALAVGAGTQQRIQTYQCPETFCSAAEVQVATASGNSSAIASASAVNSFSQCAYPRLASPTNLLCGECAEGYRPWGNKCDQCDSIDGALLFGLVILSLALLGWLIRSSLGSPSAGHSVVVLYFVQTAMLELGSLNNLLSWLNIVLLSPNSVGRCVAPLSPYEQVQAQILTPVVLELELLCIGVLHWFAFLVRGGAVAAARQLDSSPLPASAPLSSKLRSSIASFVSLFSVDLYVAASLSLLLFCYTQVAVACMSYLHCVDVGSESVVFSQPSMRCSSADYARTWVLVMLALVGFVAGFPLFIGWFLWFRADRVHGAQAIIADRAKEEKAKKSGEPVPTRTSSISAASDSSSGRSAASVVLPPALAPASLPDDEDDGDVPAEWGAVRRRRDVIAVDGTIVKDTSSAAAITAESMANERFLRRYAPVFAMYRPSAWFWQAFMLCRRTVFVALSIGLVSTPRARFLAFGFAHVLSLLLQLISSPFRLEFFNRAEFASHLLLITLSMTLTAYLSPYPFGIDLFLFLLVILPLASYLLIASRLHVGERRARKALLEYAQRQEKRRSQGSQLASAADSDPNAVGVEMGEIPADRIHSPVALDSHLQLNPAAEGGLLGPDQLGRSDQAQLE